MTLGASVSHWHQGLSSILQQEIAKNIQEKEKQKYERYLEKKKLQKLKKEREQIERKQEQRTEEARLHVRQSSGAGMIGPCMF